MKRLLSAIIAASMALSFVSIGTFAASVSNPTGGISFRDSGGSSRVYDEDDDNVTGDFSISSESASSSSVTADEIYFGKTYYFEIGNDTGGNIAWDELTNSSYFNFKLDRDKNSTYIDSVKLVTKSIGGSRRAYIAVKLKAATLTEEKQVTFDVYFSARKNAPSGSSGTWSSGDVFNARFSLWATNNTESGNDANINTGAGVVFDPVSNETNTITWGADDDVASLVFVASSDAQKFFAKLSTKVNNTIYSEYGDPVDADLYFRSFSGSSVDATSRATLTLYNPWSDNSDRYNYRDVNPRNVYIYRVNGDYIEDITDQFTYVDDGDTPSGLDGWQTRVRTLGSYVISDRELEIMDDYEDEDDDIVVDRPTTPSKPLSPMQPPAATGASDFGALAMTLSFLSAATLILCKKRRK